MCSDPLHVTSPIWGPPLPCKRVPNLVLHLSPIPRDLKDSVGVKRKKMAGYLISLAWNTFSNVFSPIHRINHYLVDKYWGNQFRYPLDKDLRNLINIALGILK